MISIDPSSAFGSALTGIARRDPVMLTNRIGARHDRQLVVSVILITVLATRRVDALRADPLAIDEPDQVALVDLVAAARAFLRPLSKDHGRHPAIVCAAFATSTIAIPCSVASTPGNFAA